MNTTHEDITRTLTPMPRGTVIPRYWGDASRFGGEAKLDWAFDERRAKRASRKSLARKALLASL